MEGTVRGWSPGKDAVSSAGPVRVVVHHGHGQRGCVDHAHTERPTGACGIDATHGFDPNPCRIIRLRGAVGPHDEPWIGPERPDMPSDVTAPPHRPVVGGWNRAECALTPGEGGGSGCWLRVKR